MESPQAQYDQLKLKFGYMGVVNHKTTTVLDLFSIMRECRSPEEYKIALQAMNLFYNFGIKLKHREIASRLLACAMASQAEDEAVELIKLYGTWLQYPPDLPLVYAVMGHFLDAGKHMVVREIAAAVREDWRFKVDATLYVLAIEAMLQLPEDQALLQAVALHADAGLMGVRLPAPVHLRVLDAALWAFQGALPDPPEELPSNFSDLPDSDAMLDKMHSALRVADSLVADGHVRGGGNAATLCSLAWLFWHLEALPPTTRAACFVKVGSSTELAGLLGGSWARVLEAAIENFGCHWGFSDQLPGGFFVALEGSADPIAQRLAQASRLRFGRFYPRTRE